MLQDVAASRRGAGFPPSAQTQKFIKSIPRKTHLTALFEKTNIIMTAVNVNVNNKNAFHKKSFIFTLTTTLVLTCRPASSFAPAYQNRHRPRPSSLFPHNSQLVSDLMRIEWVERSVRELQDLEAASTTQSSLTAVDREDSVVVSEPSLVRVDDVVDDGPARSPGPSSTSRRQQPQVDDDDDVLLADAVSVPHIDPAEVQRRIQARLKRNQPEETQDPMDDAFADAVSEPHIDPATLQRRIQARLQKTKTTKTAPALKTAAKPRTVQVEF